MKNALCMMQKAKDSLEPEHYLISIAHFENGDWYVNGFSESNGQGSLEPTAFDGGTITNIVCRSLSNNNRNVQERILISGLNKNKSIKITRLDTGKSTTLPKHQNEGVWMRTGVNDPIFTREYGKIVELIIEYA